MWEGEKTISKLEHLDLWNRVLGCGHIYVSETQISTFFSNC